MDDRENEDNLLRSVALQDANAILLAPQPAEQELRQAKEALRQQSEWLRIVLSSIGDAVIATDAEGRVSFMNGVAEALTGWPQSEAVGRPLPEVFRIVNEHTWRSAENPALRARREGTVAGLANHPILIARDGTEKPIDDRAAPMRGTDGTAIGSVLVFRDVTERNRTDEHLRASEGRHRFLAELGDATQALTDPSAMMAAIARLLAEYLGVDRCAYAEVENEEVFVITGDHSVGVPSIVGRWPVAAFGAECTRLMLANEPYVVDDVDNDPRITTADLPAYRATHIQAVICIPLHKDGTFTAAMAVHQRTPRRWTNAEVQIVTTVVARSWEALERTRVTRNLRESEARFRRLAAASIIGVIRWDLDRSLILDANDEFLRMTGYDRADLAAGRLNFRTMTPPEWAERNEVGIHELRSKGVGGAYEKEYFRKDGERVPIIIVGVRFEDSPSEGMSFVLDITERKRAEQELARLTAESERERRLYETILSSTPDLVYVFGLDHRFTYANKALLNMWGRTWDDAIGKNCLELGYPDWHAAMHDREIEHVVATKLPIRGEVPFTGAPGRRIYDYIFVPVIGANGEVEAVAGTTRDVTERKQAEEDLKAADRKKDEFLALLAHELRNPLAPIRNGLQVMRLAPGDPEAITRARTMMDRQLAHMVRLIDDLMDVSRISRNKLELRRSRVLLADIVNSAVETARPLIDAAGHVLTVSLPAPPIHLDADLTRLAQVFGNLLTNSAKYTEPGGRIWLTAQPRDGTVLVSVRDNGIGIPAESLESIFDMFSQVDRSIERSAGGLGIGLALVKGLVEMHGGAVAAASGGHGQGSTFTVTLPILEKPIDSTATETMDGEQAATAPKRRVLVVDDNRDGADSLAMMLRLMNNEVRTANDGIEAVATAEAFRPEVILMDVAMPKLNGLDATRRIRAKEWGRRATIIALTGWGQDGDRERSREAGCDGHLVKPVNLPELEEVLGGMLRE